MINTQVYIKIKSLHQLNLLETIAIYQLKRCNILLNDQVNLNFSPLLNI